MIVPIAGLAVAVSIMKKVGSMPARLRLPAEQKPADATEYVGDHLKSVAAPEQVQRVVQAFRCSRLPRSRLRCVATKTSPNETSGASRHDSTFDQCIGELVYLLPVVAKRAPSLRRCAARAGQFGNGGAVSVTYLRTARHDFRLNGRGAKYLFGGVRKPRPRHPCARPAC